MFVKYKTPKWYLTEMDKIMCMPWPRSLQRVSVDAFDADLKKAYCCADTIVYTSKKMQEAVGYRNKVKKEYSDKFEMLYSKKNCSSNYNLLEAYAKQANGDFFTNVFWAKNNIKELKQYIIASRITIKQNLAEMHDIWKKWYRKLVCTEKEKEKPAQAPKRKYQLTLTRAESLQLLKKLTYALKKDPTKDNFVMTLNEL